MSSVRTISIPYYEDNSRTRRAIVVAAGLLFALGIGLLQAMSLRWAIVIVSGVVLTALAICKMEAAIVIFTLTSFIVAGPFFAVSGRFGHTDGLYSSELTVGLLVAVWGIKLILLALQKKKVPLERSPIDLPLFSLLAAAIISFIAAHFTWDYRVPTEHKYYITQVTEIGLLCMPITVYLLVSHSLKDIRWVKATYFAILAVGVVVFVLDWHWITPPVFLRIRWGPLLVIPLVSFVYAYVILRKSLDLKWLAAACFLSLLLVNQFSGLGWVVRWFATAVSLCVISWHRSKKLFAVVVCVALAWSALRADVWSSVVVTETASRSLARFDIWKSCVRIALTRPLWGIGPDNFYPYYWHYFAKIFETPAVSSAHNNYLQILVQYGFLGLGAFLWLLYRGYRMLAKFYRAAAEPWEKTVFLGATGVFACMACAAAFADYFIPARANGGLVSFSTTVYTWIVLGVAVGLKRVAQSKAAHPTKVAVSSALANSPS